MRKTLIISIFLFVLGVLLFTRIDFLVNNILYQHGLRFSFEWHSEYSFLYFLAYQFMVLVLSTYSKSLKFLIFTEGFIISNTQDLMYFGLWQQSFPSGSWTWLWYNPTTEFQIILSFMAIMVSVALPHGLKYYFHDKALLKNARKRLSL